MTGELQNKTGRSRGRRLAGAVALLLAFAGPVAAVTPTRSCDSGLEAERAK